MKRIAAVVPEKSYAPELYALQEYLRERKGVVLELVSGIATREVGRSGRYDAIYRKMGFAPRWQDAGIPEIHDYSSASTGRFRRGKDQIKTRASLKPVLRSFLSEEVRSQFHFRDGVPFVLRDMGVPDNFLRAGASRGGTFDYDLLYAGSITSSRRSADLFRAVDEAGLTLLAVGEPDTEIYAEFKARSGIEFTGRVPYAAIPEFAARCRFGVNYTPDVPPYNFQTSTKVLEYLALGLPVITNDYAWVRSFERESGARLIKISDMRELNRKVLSSRVNVPDMSSYSWRAVFDASGVHQALLGAL